MLIGMNKKEIDEKLNDIIEFSELGDFIYEPLKTYSSGMAMRLAFAIAIHSNPQILIVDEALSVGDAHFSAKCTRALRELKKKDLSIIYVSHDLNSLKLLCDRLILLNNGEIVEEGEPERVINKYNFFIAKLNKEQQNLKINANEYQTEYGNFKAKIRSVKIYGVESKSNVISAGEEAIIEIEIESYDNFQNVNVGILIRDKFGQDIFGTSSYNLKQKLILKTGKIYHISFKLPMNIGVGKYTLSTALALGETHLDGCLHWKDFAQNFEIAGVKGNPFIGLVKLDPSVEVINE